MYLAKFVTETLRSPTTSYRKINYSHFGIRIEVNNASPEEKGQCARGIHCFRISETLGFSNILLAPVLIILRVRKSDIIWDKGNGKMRVRGCTPVRRAKGAEYDILRRAAIEAGYGYEYATLVDKEPRNDTRQAAINERCGYSYALNIDKCHHDNYPSWQRKYGG